MQFIISRMLLPAWAFVVLGFVHAPVSLAGEDGSFANNLRWTIDSSVQQWVDSSTEDWSDRYAVGLDLHKVFTGPRGDIATLILQPYVLWMPGDRPRPSFFDGRETALTWRIANVNWALLNRGKLNLRVGHFEVPFGLEHEINTNGTLRQYSNGPNLGLKGDWGISLNGLTRGLQYEAAVTRGTGQEYNEHGNPHVFSARVGRPFGAERSFGIAVFDGRVQTPAGLVERTRYGVDMRTQVGALGVMAELAYGDDDGDDVVSWLAELNWRNGLESVLAYLQVGRLATDLGDSDTASVGVRWLLSRHFTIAGQFSHQRRANGGLNNESRFHFRYRL